MRNNYRQVNWKDGMIIQSNHFIETENFFIEQDNFIRKLFVNEYNYGLLPYSDIERAFKVDLVMDNNKLLIKELKCNAITIDGSLIMIDINDYKNNLIDSDSIPNFINLENTRMGNYDLIIKVNPFERIDYGEINTENTPYRRLSVLPRYELVLNSITQDRNISFGDNFFAIARLSFENNQIIKYDYVPPSVSIKSHPILEDFYNFILSSFVNIENYLTGFVKVQTNIQRAYDVVIATSRDRSKVGGDDKTLFLNLTLEMLKFVSRNKFSLTYLSKYEPPVSLIEKIINLAVITNIELSLIEQAVRDKYIKKVNDELIETNKKSIRSNIKSLDSNLDNNDFISIMNYFINYTYNHIKIVEAVDITEQFINCIMILCNLLTSSAQKQPLKRTYDIYVK